MPNVDIIQLLKQDGGEKFYPVTHVDAVIGLKDASFFELVQDTQDPTKYSVKLKSEYTGLWAEGWLAAGGVGSGSGGGGGGGVSFLKELTDVYHTTGSNVLRADGTPVVAGDALVYNSILGWVASPATGGGVSLSWVTTTTYLLDSQGRFLIDRNGNLLATAEHGAVLNLLNAGGSIISSVEIPSVCANDYLSFYVPTSRTINGHALTTNVTLDAVIDFGIASWALGGSSGSTIPFELLPTLYVAGTAVSEVASRRTLLGVSGISNSLSSTGADSSLIAWDSVRGAWHLNGNLYADGWIASGGIGEDSGGGVYTLNGLDDVSLSNPATGQVLHFNGSVWSNIALKTINSTSIIGSGNIDVAGSVSVTNYGSSSTGKIASVAGTDIYNGIKWGTYDSSNSTVPVTINGTTRVLCVNGYSSGGGGSLSPAATSSLGGIKVGKVYSTTPTINPVSGDVAGKYYYVEVDSTGLAFVNVPWTGGGGGGISSVSLAQGTANGTLRLVVDGTYQSDVSVPGYVDALPLTGGTLTGDLRMKPTSADYGSKIRFGNSDYVYLHEDTDDHLTIYADKGITLSTNTGYGLVAPNFIDIGDARLVYDSGANALHITRRTGGTSNLVGLFADGFVAAGGVAGQSTTSYVDLDSNQTIGGNKRFTGASLFNGEVTFNSNQYALTIDNDEINFESRLYIQYNNEDVCLTRGGKTIIGPYPGSTAIGSNKLYVGGSACFAGIIDTGYSSGHVVSIQDIVNRIVALENA